MSKNTEEHKKKLFKEIEKMESDLFFIEMEKDKLAKIIFHDETTTEEEKNKYYYGTDEITGYRSLCEKSNELENKIKQYKAEALPIENKYMSHFLYSDVHAYKVVREYTEKKYGVVRLIAKCKEKMSNEWEFEVPEYVENEIITVRKHKNGKWYFANDTCPLVLMDEPYEHFDYSF